MHVIAFTGLHGVGKTFLAEVLAEKLGASYVNKRDVLRVIHSSLRTSDGSDYVSWYRELYLSHGGFYVMSLVVAYLENTLGKDAVVMLDSVHNKEEIRFLKERCSVLLVLVTSPKGLKAQRLLIRDGESMCDHVRIDSAHDIESGRVVSCLYAESDWSFCNTDSSAFVDGQIEEFVRIYKTLCFEPEMT
jgi:hypothetical protein